MSSPTWQRSDACHPFLYVTLRSAEENPSIIQVKEFLFFIAFQLPSPRNPGRPQLMQPPMCNAGEDGAGPPRSSGYVERQRGLLAVES